MRDTGVRAPTSAMYQRFVETAPVGIYQTTIDGRLLFTNETLVDMFGYGSVAEALDSDVGEHYVDDDAREAFLSELQETGNVEDFETSMQTTDGEILDVVISGSLIDEHVIGTVFDITKRNRRLDRLNRLDRAVEATGHAVIITDSDGTIEYVNPAFENITGFAEAEAVGETPRILKSGEMPGGYYEELWETLLEGEVWEEEVINRRKNGELYHAHQTIAPVTDPSEEIEAFVAIQTDITERIELEEAREREHEHLLRTEELASVGGWEFEPATETLRWTNGTRRIFEVDEQSDPTIEEVIELYHPADRPKIRKAVDSCLEFGVPYSLDLRIITDEGRQRWVHTRGKRLLEDGDRKLVGVVQDITNHKTDEQRLMVLNRVLRHNLKNELNVVRGYAETLSGDLPPESREYFDNIAESADRLLSLADKSRRFNQVLEYDYTAEPVDVEAILTQLCDRFAEDHPNATIECNVESVAVPGNTGGLRIVFEELLANAIKHHDGPDPVVRVSTTRPSEQRIAISVSDDGPGLPETEQAVIGQGEETALMHSDGMGLWIVNWLVTKLSGGVAVEASEDDGSTITVTLPTTEME